MNVPFGKGPILLVTATEIETVALHKELLPRIGAAAVRQEVKDAYTYYIARLGNVDVIHMQCVMGSMASGGSILSVSHAIRSWKPCAIIMVGIAFGIDEQKQNIADVLVSRQIVPYEQERIGVDKTQQRGLKAQAGPILSNHFASAKSWHHPSEDGKVSRFIQGDLLSGEKLIDDKAFRDKLAESYGPVIGGEMEGCGLTVAARDGGIPEWIVVKGICDFADGNKSTNKKLRQQQAAAAAVSLCKHVLQNIEWPRSASEPITARTSLTRDIFFTSFRTAVEPYYLARSFDEFIVNSLKQGNLWLYGNSGVGKTVSLQRSATQLGLKCIFVDLSSSVNAEPKSLFEDAFWQITSVLGVDPKMSASKRHQEADYWVRAISSLISQHLRQDTLIIIDEFSLRSQGDLEYFFEHAISLVLKLTNLVLAPRLHLAFSSAVKPIGMENTLYAKVNERIPFAEMIEWTPAELMALAEMLLSDLGLKDDVHFVTELKIKTPRTLKTLLRLHLMETSTRADATLQKTAKKYWDELCL